MIRLSDNMGGEEVFILGNGFQLRISSIKKTAGLSFDHIRLTFASPEEFYTRIPEDYTFVAVETCNGSTNLFTTRLPEKIVFFFGNERKGIPEEIIEKCKIKVHIPMTGGCKSMNVSHALAVALFEWQRQMLFHITG